MPLDYIRYVTSGLTLVAFIIATVAWLYKSRSEERERLIKSVNEADRPGLIRQTLEFFDVGTAHLTAKQQYDIAMEQIRNRAERFRITMRVGFSIAVMLAIISSYALYRPADQTAVTRTLLIDSFERRYDTASQLTNADKIETLIDQIASASHRQISSEHILVDSTARAADKVIAKAPDLVIIHLSSFFLSTNKAIDTVQFDRAMDTFGYFVKYILDHTSKMKFLVYTRVPPTASPWGPGVLEVVQAGYKKETDFVRAHTDRMQLLELPWDAKFSHADVATMTESALRTALAVP